MALAVTVPVAAQETPLLLVYRDFVTPGRESAYRALEEEAARHCADHGFTNPHVALESLSGPTEVWWLNAFASEAARARATEGYLAKPALVAALQGIGKRKAEQGLTGAPLEVLTTYRSDLSRGASWSPAGARFVVVTVTRKAPAAGGAVFEAPDGTLYVLTTARTQRQAEREAAAHGPEARVFAVRPYWGMAAPEWIAADPGFWEANPMARRR